MSQIIIHYNIVVIVLHQHIVCICAIVVAGYAVIVITQLVMFLHKYCNRHMLVEVVDKVVDERYNSYH